MKRMNYIIELTALLFTGAAFIACSNDKNDVIPEQSMNPSQKTYTLTVQASKNADATTRALYLSGSTLNAVWSVGDEVKVYNGDTEIGTLTAQNSGTNTTLTGNLTSVPSVGDNLTLKFLSPDYTTQGGTLEYIATNCDYAIATVTVNTVNTSEKTITTTGNAEFYNQQAIVKFTFLDKTDGTTKISPRDLIINNGINDFSLIQIPNSTYITNGEGVIFVALPGDNNQTVTVTAIMEDNTRYVYTKNNISFENGVYYTVNVHMNPLISIIRTDVEPNAIIIPNSNGLFNITTSGNYTVSGSGSGNIQCNAENVKITFNGLSVSYDGNNAFLVSDEDITINVEGENSIVCKNNDYGIDVNKKLYLEGNGKLSITTNDDYWYTRGINSQNFGLFNNRYPNALASEGFDVYYGGIFLGGKNQNGFIIETNDGEYNGKYRCLTSPTYSSSDSEMIWDSEEQCYKFTNSDLLCPAHSDDWQADCYIEDKYYNGVASSGIGTSGGYFDRQLYVYFYPRTGEVLIKEE